MNSKDRTVSRLRFSYVLNTFRRSIGLYFIKNPNGTHSDFILCSETVVIIVSKYANTAPDTQQILLEIII